MDSIGLGLVRDLLTVHPDAAVAIIDPAKQLGDARRLLAAAGIDIGTHTMLRGTAAAEFVVPADAWLVGALAVDARDLGHGERAVHIRDGRAGTLHLIRVDELHLPTGFVMVIAPDSAGTFADAPIPTAVEAAARVGVVHVDGTGMITRADDSVLSLLGRARSDFEGTAVMNLASPEDQEAAIVHWVAAKELRDTAHRWRSRVVRGDGSLLWAEVTITNRIDDTGAGDVRFEIIDISREVAAVDALVRERSLLKQLTETLPVGVAKFDTDGRIEYSNARLAQLLRRDPTDVFAGAMNGDIPKLAKVFAQVLVDGKSAHFVSDRRRDHLDHDLEWTLRPVVSPTGTITGGVLCVADVTQETQLRAALEERATTDALTGCLNWAGTINCLQTALRSASPGSGVGLLFIDLNGFKGINDRHGHAIGDRVLELVALRLRNAVRPLDMIGRLGGDEFVVVAPGLASLEATNALAGRVSSEVNSVAGIADVRVTISASIGVAWADSGDADVLLAEADRAMYSAKISRNQLEVTR